MNARKKNCPSALCMRKNNEEWSHRALPAHVSVKESTGGVCVWARTNSPATHHYPTITAQLTSEVFNVVVD